MKQADMLNLVKKKAENWLHSNVDELTKKQIKYLLENDEKELVESFYKDLEFGTGGLRGIMGVGTSRMNIYTLGMATQGLSNYLKKEFSHLKEIKTAIAHDSRNNSRLFAETTASIFAANGFKVYLFDELRPTPELSFAIRYYGCQSGVVITASHNPKEYNGYKVYWEDGGQIIKPHDKNIIAEVQKITSINEINFNGKDENISLIGKELDKIYTDKIKSLSLSPEIISRNKNLKIVYTPIHGTGVRLVPMSLRKIGFENIIHVPEQDLVSGDFPTVKSPNPEEHATLKMAIQKAKESDADIVLGTDPDSDRVGVVVKDSRGEYIVLNGNQTAALLINYLLTKWAEKGKITGKEYIVKTIVTTELLVKIAKKYGVEHFDVLTGFKYIADVIRHFEGRKVFIGGGEESYGYLAGDFVRDKDAIISCSLIAETAAWAKDQGLTLYEMLLHIYIEYGFFKEHLISIERKGKEGAEEIERMMKNFRNNPPSRINNSEVVDFIDYLDGKSLEKINRRNGEIRIPASDVLQFFTRDGSKISVRPSGTEPKIKFYFGVREDLDHLGDFDSVNTKLDKRISNIIKDLKIK
ncbi:MAG TPA: phospho-sugar mutase [Bacteroidales bacterium]|nr:phospho-sugar mutase [Bacteroidales bacterium]